MSDQQWQLDLLVTMSRKKGLVRGVVDSGLDAIPIVGTVKNVTEFFTGDLIPAREPETKLDKKLKENNAKPIK